MVLLLFLVAFSLDGVGQHLTTVGAFLLLPLLLVVDHLVTGQSAPEAPSAGMDAARAHIPAESLNALL